MPQSPDERDSLSAPSQRRGVSRRDVLKTLAAASVTTAIPGCGGGASSAPPNILFIMVDEMRFPRVFPAGVDTAAQFLEKFMPNTYALWRRGVKFTNHHSAATQCSPSRGVLVTGLYSHQTWMATTIIPNPSTSVSSSPPLDPAFPTYGKLLAAAGYATPYIGKWHLSVPHQADGQGLLSLFGFRGYTDPDPTGFNLQGTYGDMSDPNSPYYSDAYIATQASTWLAATKASDAPWCLTVAFQNPHDQEFFPAGTEYKTYTALFASAQSNPDGYTMGADYSVQACAQSVPWASNALANPPSYGYPAVPPNWETLEQIAANKPGWQAVVAKQFSGMRFGGISEDPSSVDFSVVGYPAAPSITYQGYVSPNHQGIGLAPYSYWQRGLDVYTLLMSVVDRNIGQVIDAIPADVASNTVIVFTSDHGDYSSAHGFVAGKAASLYAEAIHVPLIVVDPSGRFTADVAVERTQLTSSVDVMPMLVGFAHGGSRSWMQGDYASMYGQRYDMFKLLRSASASGRDYALFASDETLAGAFDFITPPDANGNQTPKHILGLITNRYKLGVYSNWILPSVAPSSGGQEYEYYDFGTAQGALELANTWGTEPQFQALKSQLLDVYLPNELEAPLPGKYLAVQATAKAALVTFFGLSQNSGE